ncbi:YusU family protein [Halalkalibacterium halodurans]|uniref:BH3491 protein n=2 Tax=Halalkalibacterium halodurans TaxID=86665 RepID=Q9K779_HALH5|nr:YusU family protein [Halalkalibacterium halodurans]MDY7224017.1 YusU family protein [Halalkalibacterium halodurans]MDY7243302.1 YusU family protein [Halalkalibacterium halodurans]MED3646652.1 YusU family protein [Halalkalibacterium halodurans]MED4080169.1 YusU family protein [Halalkalibacterium halodurans]MED4083392.1 YusU family protein [Halalkalibacterium halodurans]
MDEKLKEQLDGLVEKYAELLVGDTSEEMKEKIRAYAIYSHISKTMPPLAKHWSSQYPDAKEGMKALFLDIQQLNKKQRENKQ